jgi:hypothetical protein
MTGSGGHLVSGGGHSQTSSSHFGAGGQHSTPMNQINPMMLQDFGVDTSNNNLILRSSVGGQTTSTAAIIP